jgi:hypothetical protein
MQNTESEKIKNALARAINSTRDNSLRAAAVQITAGDTIGSIEVENQFPPFIRSTW